MVRERVSDRDTGDMRNVAHEVSHASLHYLEGGLRSLYNERLIDIKGSIRANRKGTFMFPPYKMARPRQTW